MQTVLGSHRGGRVALGTLPEEAQVELLLVCRRKAALFKLLVSPVRLLAKMVVSQNKGTPI